LPALSFHFGILPWDVERLLIGEVKEYLAALDKLEERA
jgi:hypothetical protein